MTTADWAILIPALAGFLAGAGAYLHSLATRSQLRQHLASQVDTAITTSGVDAKVSMQAVRPKV